MEVKGREHVNLIKRTLLSTYSILLLQMEVITSMQLLIKEVKMLLQLTEVKEKEHVNLIKLTLLSTKHGNVNLVRMKQIKRSSK